MVLIDTQKVHDFEIKRFLIPVQKVYCSPMFPKQEKSLGVIGFDSFSENALSQNMHFWKSSKSAILELVGTLEKVFGFPTFPLIPEVGDSSCPSGKVFVFLMVLSGFQKNTTF